MYKFCENFRVSDKNGMPYSLREENIHPYISMQSVKVDGNKLSVLRDNARMLFNTPTLKEFSFSCGLGFISPAYAYEKHTNWSIYFGYDEKNRLGKILSVSYYEKESILYISISKMCGRSDVEESFCRISDVVLEGGKQYPFSFVVQNDTCKGSFNGIEFNFKCEAAAGKIGLMSKSTINGLTVSDVEIISENIEAVKISQAKYVIPHYDGGSENYWIDIETKKYDETITEVSYSLSGGAFSREHDAYNMVIWSVQYDVITNPYIKFYGKNTTAKLYLSNGELYFVEQCPDGKDAELMLGGQAMPYEGKFYIENLDENSDFAFGYEMFRRLGNELSEDSREFVYRDGELLYSGKSLSEDYIITIESPEDKKITKMIPKDIDEYDKALFHAKKNHYFMHDEDAKFNLKWHLKKNYELVDFKVYLLDAFYNEIQEINTTAHLINNFENYGFLSYESNINLEKMPQGVYHLKAVMLLGEDVVCSHTSAFEVIDDSDISPRESSKIPFMYSGEAAPPNIKYNCPDPWTIKPDHNEIHYLDCLLTVPEMTEDRKGWEILKLYKRKMFLWANNRTISKGKTYADFPKSIKTADFLSASSPKAGLNYLIWLSAYKSPVVKGIYNEFCRANKQYNLSELTDDRDMTEEELKRLFDVCGSHWVKYFCDRKADNILEFQSELRKINPNVKFSSYGPYALYGSYNSGVLASEIRMVPVSRAHELRDGFWIYEDYPFITGKVTHYCSWGMMGLLLNIPKAKILVELFGSFDPVCPDGAVCYAFPPMGGCYVEPYRVITQVYEHMYASAFDGKDFRYYSNPAFQMLQSYNTEIKKKFEDFLKGWGVYLKNKPKKPMKSAVFVSEYTHSDDRFDFDFSSQNANNISQAGQAYIHGLMAESGLPKGYCTNFEGLLQLNESMTDVCILPSLAEASQEVKDKIRSLSAHGVSLVAVSDVCGLEDIFGVEPSKTKECICSLVTGEEKEYITNRKAELFYKANGADVLLCAETMEGKTYPVILKKGKNILVNSYIAHIGCEEFAFEQFGLSNVSKLLKSILRCALKELSSPLATASENCGINLFVNEEGEKRILLTDYSLCGSTGENDVLVSLNFDAKEIEYAGHKDYNIKPNLIKKDEKLKGFSVKMRPGESMIFAVK